MLQVLLVSYSIYAWLLVKLSGAGIYGGKPSASASAAILDLTSTNYLGTSVRLMGCVPHHAVAMAHLATH